MAWINNGSNEYCKESYSLQVDSDSTKGTLNVSLKSDDTVQITYYDNYVYELVLLGIGEDGNPEILDKQSHSHDHDENIYEKLRYNDGTVPASIYDNRKCLLEIGSGEILKAIYDFATNKIVLMEKNKELVNEFADQFKSYSGLIK